jgi:hypothetical protein
MNTRTGLWWGVAALVLGTAACGSSGSDPSPVPYVEVRYEWEGGFTGRTYRLDVWSDGRLEESGTAVASPATVTVSSEDLARLRAIVHGSAFRRLAASYVPRDACCDRRLHDLEVTRSGRTQRVETLDGADNPGALDAALAELQRLQERIHPPR